MKKIEILCWKSIESKKATLIRHSLSSFQIELKFSNMSAAAPEIKITDVPATADHPHCMACSDTDSDKERKMKRLLNQLEFNDADTAADAFTKYIMSLCYVK